MAVVGMVPRAVMRGSGQSVTLDLVNRLRQHGDVSIPRMQSGVQSRVGKSEVGIGVRRRHVGGCQCRGWSRTNGLGSRGRSHDALMAQVRTMLLVWMLMLLAFITPPRVGVVVYSRMPGEFVGSGELLAAARELAAVWLLTSVRPNVSGLML